jgi:hypothetical protein
VPVAAASTPTPTAWRTLGSWSGRGNRQTESFDVVTGALRLRWETVNERAPGAGRLSVALHSAISGRALQTIVDHQGVGAATATLSDEPRTSYLVVEAADIDWRLTLEEAVSGAPAGSLR